MLAQVDGYTYELHKVACQNGVWGINGTWPVATLWVQPLSLVSCCSWRF